MEDPVIVPAPVKVTAAVTATTTLGPVRPVKRRVSRCLFGRPDPHNVDQWLADELDKIRHEQQHRWGFVLDPENPCVSTVNNDWEFTVVPAYLVPHFYRTSYYSSSPCTPCDVENLMPCSSWNSKSGSVAETIVGNKCLDAELPVLPSPKTSALSKSKIKRRLSKKQTKLTAFMNVDSRKRLRQQSKDKVDDDMLFGNSSADTATAPSSPKSACLIAS